MRTIGVPPQSIDVLNLPIAAACTLALNIDSSCSDQIEDALKEISELLRHYNFVRKHSGLGYVTPAQFEQLTQRSR